MAILQELVPGTLPAVFCGVNVCLLLTMEGNSTCCSLWSYCLPQADDGRELYCPCGVNICFQQVMEENSTYLMELLSASSRQWVCG